MKLLILLPCLFFSLISAGPIGNLADRYELSQTRNTVGESNYTMSCVSENPQAILFSTNNTCAADPDKFIVR